REIVNHAVKLPDLEDKIAPPSVKPNSVRLHLNSRALLLVIIPYGDEAAAARTSAGKHLLKGSDEIAIREQMRHGVITGDHQVEVLLMMRIGRPHVRDAKVDMEPALGGLL